MSVIVELLCCVGRFKIIPQKISKCLHITITCPVLIALLIVFISAPLVLIAGLILGKVRSFDSSETWFLMVFLGGIISFMDFVLLISYLRDILLEKYKNRSESLLEDSRIAVVVDEELPI